MTLKSISLYIILFLLLGTNSFAYSTNNLLQNNDAEDTIGSEWDLSGTALFYRTSADYYGFPTEGDWFFQRTTISGTFNSKMLQLVDISAYGVNESTYIEFSGDYYVAGNINANVYMRQAIYYLDNNQEILGNSIDTFHYWKPAGVAPNHSKYLDRTVLTSTGLIPDGTEYIAFEVYVADVTSTSTHYGADNMYLVLHGLENSVPEPLSIILLGLSGAGIMFRRKK